MRNNSTINGPVAMSISDYTGARKTVEGMTSYKTPSNEMMLQRPLQGKISKSKNISFVDAIMKKKKCTIHYYG
jgi:hypothetical protein